MDLAPKDVVPKGNDPLKSLLQSVVAGSAPDLNELFAM